MIEKQLIDILDVNDVYCPAEVNRVNSDGTIDVKYIGWGEEWNENIPSKSSRIAIQTQTIITKAWVKLSQKFTYWPCSIYIRYYLPGSKRGEEYLKNERKVYLIPYGPDCHHLKPYKHGVWITTANIYPFLTKYYDFRYNEGICSTYSSQFQEAIDMCKNDQKSIDYKFRFDGSLDMEHKKREAKRLLIEQKAMTSQHRLSRQINILSEMKRKRDPQENLTNHNIFIPDENSKYYPIYKLFKTSIHSIHPSIVESIRNVIAVVQSTSESSTSSLSCTLLNDININLCSNLNLNHDGLSRSDNGNDENNMQVSYGNLVSKKIKNDKKSNNDIKDDNKRDGSVTIPTELDRLKEFFPFKVSSLVSMMKKVKSENSKVDSNYDNNKSGKSDNSSSLFALTLPVSNPTISSLSALGISSSNDKSSNSGSNSPRRKGRTKVKGRLYPRKQLVPKRLEIKRSQAYVSLQLIKQSLANTRNK